MKLRLRPVRITACIHVHRPSVLIDHHQQYPQSRDGMTNLINLLAMQACWFISVLGAAHDRPWLGTICSLVVVAWQVGRAAQPVTELTLLGLALVIGLVLDSSLVRLGWLSFHSGSLGAGWTAHWMLGLWLGFAATLTTSLRWLMKRPLWGVCFGALGGPAAYASGQQLGALAIAPLVGPYVLIGVGWALAMAIFIWRCQRR